MPGGEFAFIDWIRRQTALDPARVPVGPGDDCAVVNLPAGQALFTTDGLLEGTHFNLATDDPLLVGRKAMAVNLSDIAAMAGLPRAAVATVALPRGRGQSLGRALYRGMRRMAEAYDCPIVGGDVTVWREATDRLAVNVAMLGEPAGVQPVLRSGARVGDWILVTGRLGGSLLGRHLTFEPRVKEARALARAVPLHAMIDVSDGLSSDLAHVIEESNCGAEVRAAAVPIHRDADEASRSSGRSPLDHALHDGEDFELLFTTDAASAEQLCAHPPMGVTLTVIGEIIPRGLFLVTEDGGRRPLAPGGYEHDLGD